MKKFAIRMRDYLREMMPVPRHLLLAVLVYLGIAVYARYVHGISTSLVSGYGAAGVWSIFNILLILRLMDELKDEDIDRALFPHRPLPSGRVSRSDIGWSLLGATVLYLGVNLWVGWAFYVAVGVLVYAFLMFRRFFAPGLLRRSLPLTLVTHNPITALVLLHGFAVFAVENGIAFRGLRWELIVPFIVMLWAPFLAWELARKIRSREEEDDYVTYSRIFGPAGAVIVMWCVQAVSLGIAVYLCLALELEWAYPGVILAGLGVSLWAGVRFLREASPRTSRLGSFAAVYLFVVLVSQFVGFAWSG
jgi:4-hydroxybenzoate polyprenyltransferase